MNSSSQNAISSTNSSVGKMVTKLSKEEGKSYQPLFKKYVHEVMEGNKKKKYIHQDNVS